MASRRGARKRTFGEISKLPSGRFRARFTGPDLNRHSAPSTFVARMDAEAWLAAQERLISRGEWQPPTPAPSTPVAKPPTIAEYAATVIGRRRLRPATVALYEKLLRLAIVPAFGDRQPSEISVADVTAWYRSMNATPTLVVSGLLATFAMTVDASCLAHPAQRLAVFLLGYLQFLMLYNAPQDGIPPTSWAIMTAIATAAATTLLVGWRRSRRART